MKNLARGSMLLMAVMLLIGFSIRQQPVEAQVVIANNSQENILDDFTNLEYKNNLINSDDSESINDKNNRKINKTAVKNKEVENSTDDTADDNDDNDGENIKASNFRATAYCLKGKTANGGSVRRGIVAADPRILPLGTRITIDAGSWSGSYIVTDTGGGVRGNKIDVWVPTCSEARQFGSRSIKVRVHGKAGKKRR